MASNKTLSFKVHPVPFFMIPPADGSTHRVAGGSLLANNSDLWAALHWGNTNRLCHWNTTVLCRRHSCRLSVGDCGRLPHCTPQQSVLSVLLQITGDHAYADEPGVVSRRSRVYVAGASRTASLQVRPAHRTPKFVGGSPNGRE